MSPWEFNQLAAEVGREIVAGAAPPELPLYRAISQGFLHTPRDINLNLLRKTTCLASGWPRPLPT